MKNLLFTILALSFLVLTGCAEQTSDTEKTETSEEVIVEKTPCEESPADLSKVDWMFDVITKEKIEEVIRYDYNDKPAYFFKVIRCCDFESFLYDCEGKQICVSGGITGGTCKEIMPNLQNEKVIWKTEATEPDEAAESSDEATSQPN